MTYAQQLSQFIVVKCRLTRCTEIIIRKHNFLFQSIESLLLLDDISVTICRKWHLN